MIPVPHLHKIIIFMDDPCNYFLLLFMYLWMLPVLNLDKIIIYLWMVPQKKNFFCKFILNGVLRVPYPESARKFFWTPPQKKNNFLGGHLKWVFEGP